jgi:hypothetical protein
MFLSDDEGTHQLEMLLVAELINSPATGVPAQDTGG